MATADGEDGGKVKDMGGSVLSEKELKRLVNDISLWEQAMKDYQKPVMKVPMAVWLGVVPVWAYGVWYVKQVAMYHLMLVPTGLISFKPAGMACTVVVVGAILGFMAAIGWVAARAGEAAGEKSGREFAADVKGLDWTKAEDVRRFAKWMRKFIKGGLLFYARTHSVWDVASVAVALLLSLAGSYVWGVCEASVRTEFCIVQSVSASGELKNTAVVLDEQESRLVCYTLEPKLTPGFVVLAYPDGKGTCLWFHKIGPYWDWFGRLQEDLSIRKLEKTGPPVSG